MKHNGILLEITLALKRVSKKDFAAMLDIVPSLVSRYLSDERFSENRLSSIIAALDLPPNYFDIPLPTIDDLMRLGNQSDVPTTDHLTELESLRRLLASQRETIETQKAYIELLKSKT